MFLIVTLTEKEMVNVGVLSFLPLGNVFPVALEASRICERNLQVNNFPAFFNESKVIPRYFPQTCKVPSCLEISTMIAEKQIPFLPLCNLEKNISGNPITK